MLFWYRPLFVLELLIAESAFAFVLPRRKRFLPRLCGGFLLCFGAAFAYPIPHDVVYTAWYCALMFVTLFAMSVLTLSFSFAAPLRQVLCCAIAGYTVQHIAQESYEFLNVALGLNGEIVSDFYGSGIFGINGIAWFSFVLYLSLFFIVYLVLILIFAVPMRRRGVQQMKNSYVFFITIIITFIDAIFSSVVTYSVAPDTNALPVCLLHLFNMLCCVLVLVLLFELPRRLKSESDLESLKRIHNREKEHYFQVKESIDLINLKCHDLRHQIRVLSEAKNIDRAVAEEIEGLISVYDSNYRTENEALDVILTEKSLVCRKSAINLSCIADGTSLSVMRETDVFALFGNILDNAIDAVRGLEEERRYISLSVKRYNDFLIIHSRNAYSGNIVFENGLPGTKKADTDRHGFGMKSIRYIVKKYGGEMTIRADNGIFNLNLVFPLCSGTENERYDKVKQPQ